MNHHDIESIYEALATRIDAVGEANANLFLAKLVLLLAQSNGDADRVRHLIDSAAESLSGPP